MDELASEEKQSVFSELFHHGQALGFTCDYHTPPLFLNFPGYLLWERQVYIEMIPDFSSPSLGALQLWAYNYREPP